MSDTRKFNSRRFAALAGDPWIGVHALTEFIFCPRAGRLAFDSTEEEPEAEQFPHLNYVSRFYDEIQITAALNDALGGFVWCSGAAVVSVGLLVIFGSNFGSTIFWLTVLVAGCLAAYSLYQLGRLFDLLGQRAALRGAPPREPDPALDECQAVNWWSLLNAGYESASCRDILRDEAFHIAGKPWRVLRKGSYRIPVFRMRGGTAKLYPQHLARMAGYCHLLEACEGQESPFGIVLFPNSFDGQSVPNSAWSQRLFYENLAIARRTAVDKRDPGLPETPRCCSACDLGYPRVYRPGETDHTSNGQRLSPHLTTGVDTRMYHSLCGDRFKWVPPHDRAAEKKLLKD